MWILLLALLLLGAQLNLSGLVPLHVGDNPPPWWVGGRLIWPFAENTNTLIAEGNLLNTLTPILAATSALCFLMAAATLMKWFVPDQWFPWLIIAGAVLSIALQVIWFSGWAILPLVVDIILLWAVLGWHITVAGLRT